MENLNEALADLRDRLATDGYKDGLVEEVAEDWGLKPALLARKFEEKHVVSAAAYTAPVRVEIDYAAKFEKIRTAMAERGWTLHGRMAWAELTAAEQAKAKHLIEQTLSSKGSVFIAWK